MAAGERGPFARHYLHQIGFLVGTEAPNNCPEDRSEPYRSSRDATLGSQGYLAHRTVRGIARLTAKEALTRVGRAVRKRVGARSAPGNAVRESTETHMLPRLGAGFGAPVVSFDADLARRSDPPPSSPKRNRLTDCVGEARIATITNASLGGPTAPDSVDPVEQVRFLAAQLQDVKRALQNEVVVLLNSGHSWTTIGRALGLTRQGARQRYRYLVDGADGTCSCGSRLGR